MPGVPLAQVKHKIPQPFRVEGFTRGKLFYLLLYRQAANTSIAIIRFIVFYSTRQFRG